MIPIIQPHNTTLITSQAPDTNSTLLSQTLSLSHNWGTRGVLSGQITVPSMSFWPSAYSSHRGTGFPLQSSCDYTRYSLPDESSYSLRYLLCMPSTYYRTGHAFQSSCDDTRLSLPQELLHSPATYVIKVLYIYYNTLIGCSLKLTDCFSYWHSAYLALLSRDAFIWSRACILCIAVKSMARALLCCPCSTRHDMQAWVY